MSLSYGFALQSADNSASFSHAFYSLVGDGVSQSGGRFSLTVNGFRVTVSSGYAFAAGRWLENDEPLSLTIQPPGNGEDRTDAIAARVDYESKTVRLEVLTGVDAAAIRNDPSIIRNGTKYSIILYLVRVRRGATSLSASDITDVRADGELCGTAAPLSSVSGDVFKAYQFLASGIDAEVDRVTGLSEEIIEKANKDIAELNEQIKSVDGAPQIGELLYTCITPTPQGEWILCDGGAVPAGYPTLSALLGGVLPNISTAADRYRTYIYGGAPG